MKDFSQILSEAKFRCFVNDLQEVGVHKSVDDFYQSETHCVVIFKKNTPMVILKELQLVHRGHVTLTDCDGISQIIYKYYV